MKMQGPRKSVAPDTAIRIELQAETLRALDSNHHFDNYGDMEKTDVLAALAALAQETRLDIYRLLVQAGTSGLPAGQVADQLGLPSATLAFHLKELKNAGLIAFTRNGRSLIYAAVYPTMSALLGYLSENCCGRPSNPGLPVCPPQPHGQSARRQARSI